jgi:hypothetical protein
MASQHQYNVAVWYGAPGLKLKFHKEERTIHGPAKGRVKPLRFPTRPNPKVELRLLADDGKNHHAVLKDSVRVGLFQTVQPRRYFRLRESRPLDR